MADALRVLTHVRALNASVPVIVRARDEADLERLTAAGFTNGPKTQSGDCAPL